MILYGRFKVTLTFTFCDCEIGMAGTQFGPVHFFTAVTGGLPNEEITFAEIAKQAGYATGLIGRNK